MVINIPDCISAVAGLGTASYALVDSSKAIFCGVSRFGFSYIEKVINRLLPPELYKKSPLPPQQIRDTLWANWVNGTSLADQKAIAKTLVKLHLNQKTANHLASETGVDGKIMEQVAEKYATGGKLDDDETNVAGRFDLMLATILDEGYQRADQTYRNRAKLCAMVVSIAIALIGGYSIYDNASVNYLQSKEMLTALLVGLLATPLAPVAKDLSSALQAGVKAVQAARK
ncbi:MAG: hypothetical protein ABSG48_02985 [Geobacteraceae bacterium]